MPILKILYNAQDRNSHHIYMALIILLVLSEDDVFNKAVHEIVSRLFWGVGGELRCVIGAVVAMIVW